MATTRTTTTKDKTETAAREGDEFPIALVTIDHAGTRFEGRIPRESESTVRLVCSLLGARVVDVTYAAE